MTENETIKGQPLVGSAPTSSSKPAGSGVTTTSAPLQNATKTVGSEPRLWQPSSPNFRPES
jgi:hypothetical protein